MSKILVVATSGAGGDLQPLVATALALDRRGHDLRFVGDGSVAGALGPLGLAVDTLPQELDLGPRLVAAVKEAMASAGGDLAAAGPVVQRRMTEWAEETAKPVGDAVSETKADAVLTSLFGVEVLGLAGVEAPWAVVNSTFYIGPNPPRPVTQDIGPRAIPLLSRYASLVGSAGLVLHATDKEFDFSFDGLPTRHHYVGPLGIWEPPSQPPAYLDEDGDPWVLVTISSQM
jgi:UDP:flavonoid glycosyltransferase YjiC (YdhE family)